MVAEFELIDEIRRRFATPEGVAVGIGDDAAVLSSHYEIATTDVLVEGVHFRLDWCDPSDVGWKAVTASLSDVAAMGGRPGPYLATLALGPDHGDEVPRGLVDGFEARAEAMEDGLSVVPFGGDVSSTSGPLVVSITLYGEAAGAEPLLRDGAEEGDRVVLIGEPGRSAGGLAQLRDPVDGAGADCSELVEAYRRPTAQVQAGIALGGGAICTALIDVSDGLAQDLGHICSQSEVGARVELGSVPRDPELAECAAARGDPIQPYLTSGGEDFCLLGTVAPEEVERLERRAGRASWSYAWIGDIVPAASGVEFIGTDGEPVDLSETGYRHFSET